jgi:hypothetical protein
LAWKRTLQLPSAMAETWMAIRIRQRLWIRLLRSTIQSLRMPEVPVAPTMVVGKPTNLWISCALSSNSTDRDS